MTEKLIIHNFLCFENLEISLDKINILIGPQASGKSICAKLLFFFKEFYKELISATINEQTKRQFDSSIIKKFEEYFPSESWGNKLFTIRYEFNNNYIEIKKASNNNQKIILSYSDSYKKSISNLRKIFAKRDSGRSAKVEKYELLDRMYEVRNQMRNHLVEALGKELVYSQIFIPAGRSFFANLQNSIFSFLSSNNALDPFLKIFGLFYEEIKSIPYRIIQKNIKSEHQKNIEDSINILVEKILCGRHIYEKGKDFLETKDGRRISITNSSSGQQEMLPLATILATLPFISSNDAGKTIYIEEPEAHLFPSSQKSIVELIITVFNCCKCDLQFVITTHSPYVLTSINNLLQAGTLYEQLEEENDYINQLKTIIPLIKSISPSCVSVYSIEKGKCTDILCHENGLVDTNIIDSVSNELAIEFENLIEII